MPKILTRAPIILPEIIRIKEITDKIGPIILPEIIRMKEIIDKGPNYITRNLSNSRLIQKPSRTKEMTEPVA